MNKKRRIIVTHISLHFLSCEFFRCADIGIGWKKLAFDGKIGNYTVFNKNYLL